MLQPEQSCFYLFYKLNLLASLKIFFLTEKKKKIVLLLKKKKLKALIFQDVPFIDRETEMWKKCLAKGHTASKFQSWDSNLALLVQIFCFLRSTSLPC